MEEGESEEGEKEEAEGQGEESQPARETFRQGYGSGRRRANPSTSFGGGERRSSSGGGYGRREYGSRGVRDRGRDRDRDRDRGPVPVEEGQELTLRIDALGRRGEGIARRDNLVSFRAGRQAGE